VVDPVMDDAHPRRVEPKQLDGAVADEAARDDHEPRPSNGPVVRERAKGALGAREEPRQVEVLEVVQRHD
jgi:hypothetical protein